MKKLLLAFIALVATTACNNGFEDALYDAPYFPINLQIEGPYAQGDYVYLNVDDGSIAFDGASFTHADMFSCGLALVIDEQRKGYIDYDGKMVLDRSQPQWFYLTGFSEDLAIGFWRENDQAQSRYVVFDPKGKEIYSLPFTEWVPATHYKDGLIVWVNRMSYDWAIADKSGNMKVFTEYSHTNTYPYKGLICVESNGKYGMMDIDNGKLVIPCIYSDVVKFDRNGLAVVPDPDNKYSYLLINTKGDIVYKPETETHLKIDGPNLYRETKSVDGRTTLSWVNDKGKEVSNIGNDIVIGSNVSFFGAREHCVICQFDPTSNSYNLEIAKKNHPTNRIRTGVAVLPYIPMFKNGNGIGCDISTNSSFLIDRNFKRIGDNLFYRNKWVNLWNNIPKEMERLQEYYTHGTPYVLELGEIRRGW